MSNKVSKREKKPSTPRPCTRTRMTYVSIVLTPAISQMICQDIDDATRLAISRVSNIIRILAAHFIPLTDTLLLDAYEWAVEQESDVKDLLQADTGDAMIATIAARD